MWSPFKKDGTFYEGEWEGEGEGEGKGKGKGKTKKYSAPTNTLSTNI